MPNVGGTEYPYTPEGMKAADEKKRLMMQQMPSGKLNGSRNAASRPAYPQRQMRMAR